MTRSCDKKAAEAARTRLVDRIEDWRNGRGCYDTAGDYAALTRAAGVKLRDLQSMLRTCQLVREDRIDYYKATERDAFNGRMLDRLLRQVLRAPGSEVCRYRRQGRI